MQVDIAAEVSDEIKKNLANQQQAEVQTEIDSQRKVNFQSSMKVAASFEPNKFAQALQLERTSGVPARVAYDNWGQVEQIKQQDKLDGLFSTAPRTADALSNANNAIVAKGDEDNLRRMEEAVSDSKFDEQGFFEKTLGRWWHRDTVTSNRPRQQDLASIEESFDKIDAGEYGGEGFAFLYREADETGRAQMRADLLLQRNLGFDKARVAGSELAAMPQDPVERQLQQAEERGEGVAGAASVIADNPSYLGRAAVTALPDSVPGIALAMVPGVGPALAAGNEARTASRYKFEEILQEKGIDSTDPIQLMQAIRNDDLMREVGQRSARYGAAIGAVSLVSFGLLGKVLAPSSVGGKPISQGAREWINAGVQVPAQGALGALGEFTGQVAERGQYSDVKGGEVLVEGLVGALMAGPEAGVFAGKRFTNHMIQARRAERAAGLQSDLVARSLESSTRKNDPASFDAIVGQQLAGQPNEYIEIPAAKLQELNQSGMVNIPELLENVGIDPTHFTAQVELGGTIRMKNSSYLAYLAEHDALLSSSIRVARNDYSLDDVQELDRQMVADMEKVAAQFGETDQIASAYSDVMGQLLASGYERGAADTTARQYAAVMTRLAQQTGQTVEEVMAANPLSIAREIPQQVRRIKGDDLTLMLGRLRAGDIPKPADMFGKSLRDYLASAGGLDDTGGELSAFDADVGRVGRNRLARAGGKSMDDAAMAAWERGYFPGVPREDVTPNLLIDALREEAAGNPRYSVERENATLRDQADSLEALQEFLDREGVDLATATDDEIRALLSGERQDDGQVLNQFAGPGALTANEQALADAQAMLASGADAEQVRQDTGWFKGADGKWRFEIADGDAKIMPALDAMKAGQFGSDQILSVIYRNAGGIWTADVATESMATPNQIVKLTTTEPDTLRPVLGNAIVDRMLAMDGEPNPLADDDDGSMYMDGAGEVLRASRWATVGELLDHQRLYEAYPQLAGVRAVYAPEKLGPRVSGAVSIDLRNGEPVIVLGNADQGEIRKVLLHELQHVIQKIEGFAQGGSDDAIASSPEVRARISADNEAFQLAQWAEQYPEAAAAQAAIDVMRDELTAQYGDPFSDEAMASALFEAYDEAMGLAMENIEGFDARPFSSIDDLMPSEVYQRLAGEVEARTVEARSHMTDAIAKLIPPSRSADTLDADAIVTWGGEEMRSAVIEQAVEQVTLNQSAAGTTARQLSEQLESQYSGLKLDLLGSGDRVTLSRITLPKEGRGQGTGTAVMNAIVQWADDNGKTIGLTPSGDFGGSKSRLPGFYKRFGFIENKGRNRDFEISESMYREPVRTLNQSAVSDVSQIRGIDAELQAMASDLLDNGATITPDGRVYLYHRTSQEAADAIRSTGQMTAAEDGLFFSTKRDGGTASEFGDTVIELTIPLEELRVDDTFGGEAHVRVPLEFAGEVLDVSKWLSRKTLEQSGDDNARGSITFGGRRDGVRRFDIRLGKKSDLSTVLHEMGHYYLEVIGDLVDGGKANESLAADYGVIRDWLAAEPGKMLTVDQHEQFARGFEKYLAEGKAPSIELQGAFARFKRWLTGIYRDLRALNVELSPEVRGVFDRLLASEDAITEAQEALALSEQYESSITALMTPDELANYRRASQQARDDATTEIEQEILRAETRKDQEWYREQKRAVEREVRDELEVSQPYQARKWLFGNAPYPGLGKPLRLDSAAVTELFGSKSKEARFLGRARVREGGVHPEIAASMLGYINPSEMLNDMRSVPGLAEAIKTETERRMAERYPDPRVDGTLSDKAMAAVGEREAEVQAIQLRTLAREAGRKASQHRIIKEAARQHIARLKLRDVIPYTFQRASTKAAKAVEAALLDRNMPKAYEEKEKQLMNLHLYRESVKAQDLAQKKRDQAKTYMKAGAKRKRLQSASVENYELAYPDGRVEYAATKVAANQAEADGAVVTPLFNFLEQVDGLLTKYEFGTPRRAIRQQREALTAFLASMANESIVVNPPEWILLDRAERTNWKELTIDELVDVVDMIRQIDQMAKNKLQVLKGDAWAEFEPLRDAIVATVQLNASKSRNSAFNKSFADEIRRWGREWLGTLPADQIARELDGQDDLGPVQENITTPVQLAGRNALIREKAEHQGLADLIRQFYPDDQIKGMNDASKLIAIPEIGDSMTRMQMVMLMANMGNEGNRQALLSEARGIWTAETIQAVMGKLSSNDADFVEALWAWIDKFWPEVSENEARRTGVAPAKVQGTPYPVRLADGKVRVLKGGYFPLKYDGDLSIKTSQDETANAFKNMTAGRTAKAYTPEGHKIERVGSGGRPVKLGFGVVTSHLNEVVRDIVMTDPVNQAWRFLHDRDVQSAFEKSNLKELFTALEIWMQDTAEGEVVDSSYTTAAARWLRTGFTANVMLFNLSNSALNLAGTHPLVVLGKRWALRGYRDAFAPANWNQMYELSSFMREARIDSFNKDLTLVQDQMSGKGGWRAAMVTAGFYLHNKLQMFIDAVTWMGAYQKGMSMDLVGADLVTYADQRVVEASGSGVFADRSSLERGTLSRQTRQNELVRGLTTLAGYMIRKMAIARRRTAETSFKDIGQAMNWAVDMALLFTVEGLMFALVKGNIPDDDEEDQAVEWTKTAAWETAASIGGGLPPFGRPIVAGIQGFGGGSSSIDIFAEQFGNAVAQAKQGDADVTALKSVVALVGTATKTPGIATNRVIDWLDRSSEGEMPPWYELFTGNRDK
jgi:GNAT superfamily N-acetyltransferase